MKICYKYTLSSGQSLYYLKLIYLNTEELPPTYGNVDFQKLYFLGLVFKLFNTYCFWGKFSNAD